MLIVILISGAYIAAVIRGFTESARRSVQLSNEAQTTDRILVSVLVTGVNPAAHELTAQLGFSVNGAIAEDEVTPAKDLRLLVNNIGGQQEFDFPKGKRMNRVKVELPLNGEWNRYPFDRYDSTIWLLMATPGRSAQAEARTKPDATLPDVSSGDSLAVGSVTLRHNTPEPLSVKLSASIPGIKFVGDITRDAKTQVTRTGLRMRRADNLIAVSILINVLMICLAISVLALALRITKGRENYLVPLSIAISLIFGLPALRSVQPGVPPVGALTDYMTFIWAELIVAFSAIITVWRSLVRTMLEARS
jgi:hypothetical protein